MLRQDEETAKLDDLARLHSREGYCRLIIVPAALDAADDYPPGEGPELCAICEREITAGQPFREYEGRPGFFYAHSDCGLAWS